MHSLQGECNQHSEKEMTASGAIKKMSCHFPLFCEKVSAAHI